MTILNGLRKKGWTTERRDGIKWVLLAPNGRVFASAIKEGDLADAYERAKRAQYEQESVSNPLEAYERFSDDENWNDET